jgi:uncharacterized protein (DUF2236 family)
LTRLLPVLPVRRALVSMVRRIFNDRSRGEQSVVRSSNALFDKDSVIWRVHGDVTTMMIGGVSALLLQMLHPSALAGVWEHSTFRNDMLGRLRRTARFIAVTTYGDRTEAQAAIDRVVRVHAQVSGSLANGLYYTATDPRLLAWVHVTEAVSFLDAWIRYSEPDMSLRDQDRYFTEFALIARALNAGPVPESRDQANALIASFRSELHADARTREVARLVLRQPPPVAIAAPVQEIVMRAAVDLLPTWARKMHGLPAAGITTPIVRGATTGIAATLRWAFAGR